MWAPFFIVQKQLLREYWDSPAGHWASVEPPGHILRLETVRRHQNEQEISFNLAGYASYKLTIDSGSLNCITTKADGGSLSPQFCLEVN